MKINRDEALGSTETQSESSESCSFNLAGFAYLALCLLTESVGYLVQMDSLDQRYAY